MILVICSNIIPTNFGIITVNGMNGCQRAVGGDDRMEGACARGRKPGPRPDATERTGHNRANRTGHSRTRRDATGHNGTGHAENAKKRGDEAEVYAVLSRGVKELAGTFYKEERGGCVSPDDKNYLGKTSYSYSEVLCGSVKVTARK